MDEPTNILVVDDLPEKLLVYRTILDELNQNLITAGSGEEALRAVLQNDFAVILLDVNMPGMDGLETASLIRHRKRSAHTPIIFLTAFTDEVRATAGYAQGAVDYISTPVVPAILRAKVRVFADLYRMTQQVRRQAEERIALIEERTRREAAEEANRRLAFLAHAGTVLGTSLDHRVTATDATRLACALGDEAALLVFATDQSGTEVVRARATSDGPVIAEGGRELLAPALADVMDRAASGTPEIGSGTVLAVPLRACGHVFAVLGVSRERSRRPFPPPDVAVAETLGSRAAMALENARLYHELQQADRQKNEFLSMLAHELRNPLAPIRNATEVLQQYGTDPARVRWVYGIIDRQLTHLVRLVDDLLDVSRITLGKIRLATEEVELGAVVAQAVEVVRPLVEKLGHRLEVAIPREPVHLHGDPARLIQVLANLLNNAAKYTDPGGSVSIRASVNAEVAGAGEGAVTAPPGSAERPANAWVEIRVRDTGVGIAADLLSTVFDLFTQANRSLDRSQGGLGVGLTLVRRLVEMHGGSVVAHSAGLGHGSEFVVRLPVTANPLADTEVATTGPEGSARGTALRVVVVDDNHDGAETLADLINLLGHQVRIANDGPTGISTVREFDPDVVLLDIGLPGMDGYEVARRLRRDPTIRAVLIAVSGYGREEDRALSREAGCEQHFVKPIEIRALEKVFASVGVQPSA